MKSKLKVWFLQIIPDNLCYLQDPEWVETCLLVFKCIPGQCIQVHTALYARIRTHQPLVTSALVTISYVIWSIVF